MLGWKREGCLHVRERGEGSESREVRNTLEREIRNGEEVFFFRCALETSVPMR